MPRIITLTALAALAVACEADGSRRIAGLPPVAGTVGTTSSRAALTLSPDRVQLAVGGTTQLSTNAPATLANDVQWVSLQSSIATVNQSGLVTALGAGTAVIRARYASDTTNQATATIEVTPP
jgi:uncharacterized protein YjdB